MVIIYKYELRTVDSLEAELKEQQREVKEKEENGLFGSVGSNVVCHRYKHEMVKSKSNDSLTTATSIDDSSSTIDGGGADGR